MYWKVLLLGGNKMTMDEVKEHGGVPQFDFLHHITGYEGIFSDVDSLDSTLKQLIKCREYQYEFHAADIISEYESLIEFSDSGTPPSKLREYMTRPLDQRKLRVSKDIADQLAYLNLLDRTIAYVQAKRDREAEREMHEQGIW